MAKTTITLPVNGGAVEAVSTIETVPYWTRSRKNGEITIISFNFPVMTCVTLGSESLLTSDGTYSCSNMG